MSRWYDFRVLFPDKNIYKDFAQDEFPHLYNYFSIDGKQVNFRQSRGFYEVICSWQPDKFRNERRIGYSKEYVTYRGKDYTSALANFRYMCYSLLNKYKYLGVKNERSNIPHVQSFVKPLF